MFVPLREVARPKAAVSYLAEHVALARRSLDRTAPPAAAKEAIQDWHGQEVLRLAYYQTLSGKPLEAASVFTRAFSADPLWWAHAASSVRAAGLRRRQG